MSGRPPSSCSTFARSERMRVPSPAASTMAPSGRAVDTDARVSQPADLFSRRSRPFLATRCGFSHNATVKRQVSVMVAAVLAARGCGWRPGNPVVHFRRTHLAPPARVASVPADDADRLAWAADEEYFVVVRKTCRTLDVYRFGERVESFPAVFG